jgi:hypothetical protein
VCRLLLLVVLVFGVVVDEAFATSNFVVLDAVLIFAALVGLAIEVLLDDVDILAEEGLLQGIDCFMCHVVYLLSL